MHISPRKGACINPHLPYLLHLLEVEVLKITSIALVTLKMDEVDVNTRFRFIQMKYLVMKTQVFFNKGHC